MEQYTENNLVSGLYCTANCNEILVCLYTEHFMEFYHRTSEEVNKRSSQTKLWIILCLFPTTRCSLLRLIVLSGLDVPTFATRRLHARERTVELWARNVREFYQNADFHVTFINILHAVKLRHGTDAFTFPLKEGVLRIFFALKIRRLRPGANPRTWVPKASRLPLEHRSH